MTLPQNHQQTRNMIAAWFGAIASLAVIVSRSTVWTLHLALPLAPITALAAALLIGTIVRFKPGQTTTLALCGFLGVTFTAFSCCLTYLLGR